MSVTFPDDVEIERLLEPVRASVMHATQHVRSPRQSTRFRTTRNLLIAGAAAAILTAGSVVAYVEHQSVIDMTAYCYEHASLDAQMVTVQGITDAVSGTLDPVDACGAIWRSDGFNPANDESVPGEGDHPVPDLIVCTSFDGVAAVFPREGSTAGDTDFCKALGLADWGSD